MPESIAARSNPSFSSAVTLIWTISTLGFIVETTVLHNPPQKQIFLLAVMQYAVQFYYELPLDVTGDTRNGSRDCGSRLVYGELVALLDAKVGEQAA